MHLLGNQFLWVEIIYKVHWTNVTPIKSGTVHLVSLSYNFNPLQDIYLGEKVNLILMAFYERAN